AKGVLRFAWDLPFAVHFHVHPNVEVWPGREAHTADLVTQSGSHWRLSATAAALSIEESVHNARSLGPHPAQQVVLRATCHGEAKLSWQLERLPPGREPGQRLADSTALAPSRGERLVQTEQDAQASPAEAGEDRRADGPAAPPDPQG
ncbi:MAG TPA: heparinase II/III family protein, partial [Hyphomicrobiaceae bacterium]|nr:heparinase II/III family protein [Hyphomicrobiaceae bacterium]